MCWNVDMDLPCCATEHSRSLVHAGPMYVPFLHLPLFFVFTGCGSKAAHFYAAAAVPQPQHVGISNWAGVDPVADYSATTTPYVSANNSDRRVLY